MFGRLTLLAAAALWFGGPERAARAESVVAIELVLAADVSSSVDDREYALQLGGYANAFLDPDVVAAIAGLGPDGVAVTYIQWAGHRQQVQSVGWRLVRDARSAAAFAAAIVGQSGRAPGAGTAVGSAIEFGTALIAGNGFAGARRIIDISADDRNNAGSHPSLSRDRAVAAGLTVNALAIGRSGMLARFFQDNVIGGDGAFVMTANSFDDFARAIKVKLLRELGAQPGVADLNGDHDPIPEEPADRS